MKIMNSINKIIDWATNLIAFPMIFIVLSVYLVRYYKKNQFFPPMEDLLLLIYVVKPHCFFIDFFLVAFGYLYFVN